jgi:hypothetical protein
MSERLFPLCGNPARFLYFFDIKRVWYNLPMFNNGVLLTHSYLAVSNSKGSGFFAGFILDCLWIYGGFSVEISCSSHQS